MALRITCPGCKTAMKLDDDMRGRKVRCENCDKTLNIPGSNGKKSDGDERAVQEGRKLKNAASKAEDDEPENEEQEEELPAKKKKKKKKKKGSSMGLLIGGGAAIAVLLIAVVGASAYFMTRPANPVGAQNNEQLARTTTKGGDGGAGGDKQPEPRWPEPFVRQGRTPRRSRPQKGGGSIIGNVRAPVIARNAETS